MDRIRIRGGGRLKGDIPVGGAKNAALPLMAAALLTDETLTLGNLPHVADITTMANLLAQLGVEVHLNGEAANGGHDGRVLELTARRIVETRAPYDLVRKMRASVLVLGPLVARYGRAEVSLPGGCAIGTRPIDIHLQGLRQLGAEIELSEGYVVARAPQGLTGGRIVFPKVSVGATENLLMAATLAKGESELVNAAREPEIGDLALCLNRMGAMIEGIGSDRLRIRGVERLHGAAHQTVADRIEAGTYAMAAAITDGEVELLGARLGLMGSVVETLARAGVEITETNRGLKVRRANCMLIGCD
ncbi:MAG: UDP-N-acetylglucosamine 1-carboxyvinyltransferase, partial [Gemmatimonadales bacterium]